MVVRMKASEAKLTTVRISGFGKWWDSFWEV